MNKHIEYKRDMQAYLNREYTEDAVNDAMEEHDVNNVHDEMEEGLFDRLVALVN